MLELPDISWVNICRCFGMLCEGRYWKTGPILVTSFYMPMLADCSKLMSARAPVPRLRFYYWIYIVNVLLILVFSISCLVRSNSTGANGTCMDIQKTSHFRAMSSVNPYNIIYFLFLFFYVYIWNHCAGKTRLLEAENKTSRLALPPTLRKQGNMEIASCRRKRCCNVLFLQ